jgi:hypothetical protein
MLAFSRFLSDFVEAAPEIRTVGRARFARPVVGADADRRFKARDSLAPDAEGAEFRPRIGG